jgi:hypothetical protein
MPEKLASVFIGESADAGHFYNVSSNSAFKRH